MDSPSQNQTILEPRTVEEFLESPWASKVNVVIYRFYLNEPVEDTFQDVVLSLLQKDYLARWDIKLGGSFGNWLYTFVIHMCLQKRKRSNTRGGKAIEKARSINRAGKTAEGEDCVMDLKARPDLPLDFWLRVEEVQQVLSLDTFAYFSSVEYKNVIYNRCPLTIFNLIVEEGLTPAEIASRLKTSVTWVYGQINRIRPVISQVFGLAF